jgi:hypothetical protein
MEVITRTTNVNVVDKEELRREREIQKYVKQATTYNPARSYTAPVVNPKYLFRWDKLLLNSLYAIGFIIWLIESYRSL